MLRRFLLISTIATGFGISGNSDALAGGYTTYVINMAQLNYKTPVPYSKAFRSGNSADVFTTSSACLQNINQRVAQNKLKGWDYECFLVVYTEKRPLNPIDDVSTLANCASGAYGKWAGWIVYWAPARGRGYFLNPYSQFKAFGPSAAPAATATPTFLSPPAGKPATAPHAATSILSGAKFSLIETRSQGLIQFSRFVATMTMSSHIERRASVVHHRLNVACRFYNC